MSAPEKIPARAGWQWVKDGIALYRRQPLEIATLFLAYMFMLLAIGFIPVAGQILPVLLTPVFSMAFMEACVRVEEGQRVHPGVLLSGFRSPRFPRLAMLGTLYLPAALVAIGSSALVDGGAFWSIVTGEAKLDADFIRSTNVGLGVLMACTVYTLASMAFWYAAPLIAWKDMGVFKAMFYSFFAVRKALKAFLVYGLLWVNIGVLLPSFLASLLTILSGRPALGTMVLMPLLLLMSAIFYCSFYPTYVTIFGRPRGTPPAGTRHDF